MSKNGKGVIFLNINQDLKSYLDSIQLNYGIAITDTESLIYNNVNVDFQKISMELKEFLNAMYKDKKIINYFNNYKDIEKINLEISKNKIKEKNSDNSKLYHYFLDKLLFTTNKNIKILENSNLKPYPLKCIIPIYTDFFKGSLIVFTNDIDITDELKESFFRFCKGLFFIVLYYIINGDYSSYKLF